MLLLSSLSLLLYEKHLINIEYYKIKAVLKQMKHKMEDVFVLRNHDLAVI